MTPLTLRIRHQSQTASQIIIIIISPYPYYKCSIPSIYERSASASSYHAFSLLWRHHVSAKCKCSYTAPVRLVRASGLTTAMVRDSQHGEFQDVVLYAIGSRTLHSLPGSPSFIRNDVIRRRLRISLLSDFTRLLDCDSLLHRLDINFSSTPKPQYGSTFAPPLTYTFMYIRGYVTRLSIIIKLYYHLIYIYHIY